MNEDYPYSSGIEARRTPFDCQEGVLYSPIQSSLPPFASQKTLQNAMALISETDPQTHSREDSNSHVIAGPNLFDDDDDDE